MKVLFLYQDRNLPSSRIRVFDLLPEIRKEGILAAAEVYPRKLSEKFGLFRRLKGFDVIYLQKKLLSPFDAALLRRFAGRLVFDFDDAIYYRDDSDASLISRSRYLKFRNLACNSDLLVAGNRILAGYSRQFNRNVTIVPSAVETRRVPLRDHDSRNETMVIGWIGGGGNLRHLATLSGVLTKLAQNHRFRVNIVSEGDVEIPGVETRAIPWTLDGQAGEVARFDIGIMPLPRNKWTEGKCGYKALQYMAAGVPPVVSDVGVNGDIVTDGREGFVVSGDKGFYDALAALMTDENLRRRFGHNARRKVEKSFSVNVVGKKLADILKTGINVAVANEYPESPEGVPENGL
jgi:glycosyltransferase involved in cell wall biosynthesis